MSLYDIYTKSFISNVSICYHNFILENKSSISHNTINFFLAPGRHHIPLEFRMDKTLMEYFDYILFDPNIAILDFVTRNIELCKSLKIVDYGCGVGLLSVFLAYIGIDCWNYDNGNQIKLKDFNRDVKIKLGLDINCVSDVLPKDVNMILCSGVSISSNSILDNHNLKYLLLDGRLNSGMNETIINNGFSLLEEHGLVLKIYKKNE